MQYTRFEEIFDTIRDAARMRIAMENIKSDRSGKQPLYCIDSNIIVLHLFSDSERDKVRRYCRFFTDDPEELLEPLADRVTDEILYAEPYRSNLVLLEPHRAEMERSLGYFLRQWARWLGAASHDFSSLREDIEQILEGSPEETDESRVELVLELIRSDAPRLYEFLLEPENGAETRMRRLAGEKLAGRGHDRLPVIEGVSAPGVVEKRDALWDAAEDWLDRLRKEKNEKRATSRVKNDADVLAWLVAANQHVIENPEKNFQPIYLVSGDEGMRRAFDRWYFGGGMLRELPHFIRHPREIAKVIVDSAKTDNPRIEQAIEALDPVLSLISPASSTGPRLGIISQFAWAESEKDLEEPVRKRLRHLSDRMSGFRSEELSGIKAEWQETLRWALFGDLDRKHGAEPAGELGLRARLLAFMAGGRFAETLEHQIERCFDDLLTMYSILGVEDEDMVLVLRLRRAGIGESQRRILWYPRFRDADIDRYVQLASESSTLTSNAVSQIGYLGKKLPEDDKALAHAYLNILLGSRQKGREICRRLAKSTMPEIAAEASLLDAVYLRLTAETLDDLRKAFKRVRRGEAKTALLRDGPDPRILCEKAAVCLEILDHHHFQAGDIDMGRMKDFPSIDMIFSWLREVEALLGDVCPQEGADPALQKAAEQVAVNSVGAHLCYSLGWYGEVREDFQPALMDEMLDRLACFAGDDEDPPVSRIYPRFVLAAGRWCRAENAGDHSAAARELNWMKKFVARMVTLSDRSAGEAIAEIARSDLVEMAAIVRSVQRFARARRAPA